MNEDYATGLAEREAEQIRLHEMDPFHMPWEIPADDPEFGTEAYTAAWHGED